MWLSTVLLILLVLGAAVALVILYGASRWQASTEQLLAEMWTERVEAAPERYRSSEAADLPVPVQRYFRAVLKDRQPLITAVTIEHTGTFNMVDVGEEWRPFTSTQCVITQRPGFLWDARIRMVPGLTVFVRDAYVAGRGVLLARLFGLFTVMEKPNSPELAHGELMRFFAEAAWYPTSLLPSQGVCWEPVDKAQARATLTDGGTKVELAYEFDSQGLISVVRSDGRFRSVDGVPVATPWQGRFWDYQLRDDMLVPLEGEVAWLLPEGLQPYWRGRIEHIEYDYAG